LKTIIYNDPSPLRVDKYLSNLAIEELYSRTLIDKLIQEGQVLVNEKIAKKSLLLNCGDRIAITLPPTQSKTIPPQKMDLQVVYNDEWIAVINKPAGLVVHPGSGNPQGTLVNGLMYHFQGNLACADHPVRPGIVHRLDKDTSGLIIIAKDDKTLYLLSEMFKNKEIQKRYLAIVLGQPTQDSGTVESYLIRSRKNPKQMTIAEEGKWAITHYKVLEWFHYFSLIEVGLETGRMHQIRVHLQSIGCPVLGDRLYSNLSEAISRISFTHHHRFRTLWESHLKRQALHAYQLEFTHPVTGERLKFSTDLPEDMEYTLQWLRTNFPTV